MSEIARLASLVDIVAEIVATDETTVYLARPTGASSYNVYRSTNGQSRGTLVASAVSADSVITGQSAGTEYWYQVEGLNGAGLPVGRTPYINITTPTLLPTGYYSAMAYGSVLYAAKGRYAAKSTDGGVNWTDFALQFPYELQSCFPSKTGILFACSSGRVYRSPDDGANWTEVFQCSNPPYSYVNTWGWAQSDVTGVLFAGEYGNTTKCLYLWRSVDDGLNWTRIDYFYDKANWHVHQVMVDPATGRVYVTIGDSPKLTYISDDDGDNWTQVFSGQSTGFTGATNTVSARYFADDLTPGSNRVWKTTDDATLTTVYTPISAYDTQPMSVASDGSEYWATSFNELQGAKAHIAYSPDGITWRVLMDAASGGYQFLRPAVDYRNRIPATLAYYVCECVQNSRLIRFPRILGV